MKRRVALIIETSTIYGRDLLAGIVRFMRTNRNWSVFLEQRDLAKKPPSWLADWDGDGIISRATTPGLVEAVRATGVPLVELTDRGSDHGLTYVWSDDRGIAQLGAKHLLTRGFRSFAFCGFKSEAWSKRRETAFAEAVHAAGFDCEFYNSPWQSSRAHTWEREQRDLSNWLRELPKPLGLMACNDIRGQHVLEACSSQKLTVPEEVAVVGVDNDELLCQLCDPPLSSVIPNAPQVGFLAAELLSRLMNGESVPREHLVEPIEVATRQSTDVVAVEDPHISSALAYIREHACEGISVEDVLKHVPVSRSTLERQLRRYVGRKPQQEIRHVQLKRVRELLSTTDLPTEQIALLSGFQHPEYMHVVFKRELGMTPGEFRRAAKARNSS